MVVFRENKRNPEGEGLRRTEVVLPCFWVFWKTESKDMFLPS